MFYDDDQRAKRQKEEDDILARLAEEDDILARVASDTSDVGPVIDERKDWRDAAAITASKGKVNYESAASEDVLTLGEKFQRRKAAQSTVAEPIVISEPSDYTTLTPTQKVQRRTEAERRIEELYPNVRSAAGTHTPLNPSLARIASGGGDTDVGFFEAMRGRAADEQAREAAGARDPAKLAQAADKAATQAQESRLAGNEDAAIAYERDAARLRKLAAASEALDTFTGQARVSASMGLADREAQFDLANLPTALDPEDMQRRGITDEAGKAPAVTRPFDPTLDLAAPLAGFATTQAATGVVRGALAVGGRALTAGAKAASVTMPRAASTLAAAGRTAQGAARIAQALDTPFGATADDLSGTAAMELRLARGMTQGQVQGAAEAAGRATAEGRDPRDAVLESLGLGAALGGTLEVVGGTIADLNRAARRAADAPFLSTRMPEIAAMREGVRPVERPLDVFGDYAKRGQARRAAEDADRLVAGEEIAAGRERAVAEREAAEKRSALEAFGQTLDSMAQERAARQAQRAAEREAATAAAEANRAETRAAIEAHQAAIRGGAQNALIERARLAEDANARKTLTVMGQKFYERLTGRQLAMGVGALGLTAESADLTDEQRTSLRGTELALGMAALALGTKRVRPPKLVKTTFGDAGRGQMAHLELQTFRDPRMRDFGAIPAPLRDEFLIGVTTGIVDPMARKHGLVDQIETSHGRGSWASQGRLVLNDGILLQVPSTVDPATFKAFVHDVSTHMRQAAYYIDRPVPLKGDGTDPSGRAVLVDLGREHGDTEYNDIITLLHQRVPEITGTTRIGENGQHFTIGFTADTPAAVQAKVRQTLDAIKKSRKLTGMGYEIYGTDNEYVELPDRPVGGRAARKRGAAESGGDRYDREADSFYEAVANKAGRDAATWRKYARRTELVDDGIDVGGPQVAAVRVGGRVFRGRVHSDANGQAQRFFGKSPEQLDQMGIEDGFVSRRGRFIPRDEATPFMAYSRDPDQRAAAVAMMTNGLQPRSENGQVGGGLRAIAAEGRAAASEHPSFAAILRGPIGKTLGIAALGTAASQTEDTDAQLALGLGAMALGTENVAHALDDRGAAFLTTRLARVLHTDRKLAEWGGKPRTPNEWLQKMNGMKSQFVPGELAYLEKAIGDVPGRLMIDDVRRLYPLEAQDRGWMPSGEAREDGSVPVRTGREPMVDTITRGETNDGETHLSEYEIREMAQERAYEQARERVEEMKQEWQEQRDEREATFHTQRQQMLANVREIAPYPDELQPYMFDGLDGDQLDDGDNLFSLVKRRRRAMERQSGAAVVNGYTTRILEAFHAYMRLNEAFGVESVSELPMDAKQMLLAWANDLAPHFDSDTPGSLVEPNWRSEEDALVEQYAESEAEYLRQEYGNHDTKYEQHQRPLNRMRHGAYTEQEVQGKTPTGENVEVGRTHWSNDDEGIVAHSRAETSPVSEWMEFDSQSATPYAPLSSDRPDGKVAHVFEVQSDYAQKGSIHGFRAEKKLTPAEVDQAVTDLERLRGAYEAAARAAHDLEVQVDEKRGVVQDALRTYFLRAANSAPWLAQAFLEDLALAGRTAALEDFTERMAIGWTGDVISYAEPIDVNFPEKLTAWMMDRYHTWESVGRERLPGEGDDEVVARQRQELRAALIEHYPALAADVATVRDIIATNGEPAPLLARYREAEAAKNAAMRAFEAHQEGYGDTPEVIRANARLVENPNQFRHLSLWADQSVATQTAIAARMVDALNDPSVEWIMFDPPANRMDRASLSEEAAKAQYGSRVPKAMTRILQALGMKTEWKSAVNSTVGGQNIVFPALRVTSDMRNAARRMGITMFGALMATALGAEDAEAQSTEDKRAETEGARLSGADKFLIASVAAAGLGTAHTALTRGVATALADVAAKGARPWLLTGAGAAMSMVPDDDYDRYGKGVVGLAALNLLGWSQIAAAKGAVGRALVQAAKSHGAEGAIRFFDPDALLTPEVRAAMATFREYTARGRAKARMLRRESAALGPEGDRAVTDVIRHENWEPGTAYDLNAVLTVAAKVVDEIRTLGQAKLQEHILSQDAWAASGGDEYLTRLYAYHEAQKANPARPTSGAQARGRQMTITAEKMRTLDLPVREAQKKLDAAQAAYANAQASKDAYAIQLAQGRVNGAQMELDVAIEERDIARNALGEIREASYLAGHAMEKGWANVGAAIAFRAIKDAGVTHPEWTAKYDEFEAARVMLQQARAAGNQADADVASQMMKAARDDMNAIAARYRVDQKTGWVTLSDAKGLGALRGAVVPKEVALAVEGLPSNGKLATFTRWWKEAKTVWNVPTHVGNFAGNVSIASLAGLPLWQQPRFVRNAFRELRMDGPHAQTLAEHGILGLSAITDEPSGAARGMKGPSKDALLALRETTRPETERVLLEQGIISRGEAARERGDATAATVIEAMEQGNDAFQSVRQRVKGVYENTDNLFRLAVYLHAIEPEASGGRGLPQDEALRIAREDMGDFHSNSPALDMFTRYVSPFFRWTKTMVPTAARLIVEHPERWIALTTGLMALNELGQADAGYDLGNRDVPARERENALGALLPDLIQIPYPDSWKRKSEQVAAMDFTRWTPFSALTTGGPPGTLAGRFGLPTPLAATGPASTLYSILRNTDEFTGRPIFTLADDATNPETWKKAGGKVIDFALPTTLGFWRRKLMDDAARRNPEQLATDVPGLFGIRPRLYEPGNRISGGQRDLQDALTQIKREYRNKIRGDQSPDKSFTRKAREKAREQMNRARANFKKLQQR